MVMVRRNMVMVKRVGKMDFQLTRKLSLVSDLSPSEDSDVVGEWK